MATRRSHWRPPPRDVFELDDPIVPHQPPPIPDSLDDATPPSPPPPPSDIDRMVDLLWAEMERVDEAPASLSLFLPMDDDDDDGMLEDILNEAEALPPPASQPREEDADSRSHRSLHIEVNHVDQGDDGFWHVKLRHPRDPHDAQYRRNHFAMPTGWTFMEPYKVKTDDPQEQVRLSKWLMREDVVASPNLHGWQVLWNGMLGELWMHGLSRQIYPPKWWKQRLPRGEIFHAMLYLPSEASPWVGNVFALDSECNKAEHTPKNDNLWARIQLMILDVPRWAHRPFLERYAMMVACVQHVRPAWVGNTVQVVEHRRLTDRLYRDPEVRQQKAREGLERELLRIRPLRGQGLILKDMDALYTPGTHQDWLKIRVWYPIDVMVVAPYPGADKAVYWDAKARPPRYRLWVQTTPTEKQHLDHSSRIKAKIHIGDRLRCRYSRFHPRTTSHTSGGCYEHLVADTLIPCSPYNSSDEDV